MLVKILLSFLTSNIQVLAFRSKWQSWFEKLLDYEISGAEIIQIKFAEFPAFDCLFAGEPSGERYYSRLVMFLSFPIVAVVAPAVPLGIRALYLRVRGAAMHPESKCCYPASFTR